MSKTKLLFSLCSAIGVVESSDDDGTNLLQTRIVQQSGGDSYIEVDFDFDENRWAQKDGCTIRTGYLVTCYATLTDAMDICDTVKGCQGVSTQSDICFGDYRVAFPHPDLYLDFNADWKDVNMRSWVLTKPLAEVMTTTTTTQPVNFDFDKNRWTQKDGCSVHATGQQNNSCYTTLKEAMEKCDVGKNCKAVATERNYCDGYYRVVPSLNPTMGYTGSWEELNKRCWVMTKTVAEAGTATTTTTEAITTTTTMNDTTTTVTSIPGGNTNPGGQDCFAAIATWGPDFDCNDHTASFCGDDSADGLDVALCCQDYCGTQKEKQSKKNEAEGAKKQAEGDRKSKRKESRSKRKVAESERKKTKKEDAWLAKRGAQEAKNKNVEDERKNKNGFSESKTKNERSWKATRAVEKKVAQRRETKRKVNRVEQKKKNGSKWAAKKPKRKEQWKKSVAARKEKKSKGVKGRKGTRKGRST